MRVSALLLTVLVALLAGCTATGPKLYSPVIPIGENTQQTAASDAEEEVTVIRATRNAERWCRFYRDSMYQVVTMDTTYHGIYGSAQAARNISTGAQVARKLTLGVINPRTNSDWKTTLVFTCQQS